MLNHTFWYYICYIKYKPVTSEEKIIFFWSLGSESSGQDSCSENPEFIVLLGIIFILNDDFTKSEPPAWDSSHLSKLGDGFFEAISDELFRTMFKIDDL